jgi:hypothetical protein
MNFCWLVLPLLFLGVFFHFLILKIMEIEEIYESISFTLILVAASFLVSLPGVYIMLGDVGFFRNTDSFYNFRSINNIELSCSLLGLLTGSISGAMRRGVIVANIISFIILTSLIISMFSWSYGTLIQISGFETRWENNVCEKIIDHTESIASAATVFRHYNIPLSEKNLAKESFAFSGGVHSWFIARAFTNRGFSVKYYSNVHDMADIKYPCFAEVVSGDFKYLIPILGIKGNTLNVGDPIKGRLYIAIDEFMKLYEFTGLIMTVENT